MQLASRFRCEVSLSSGVRRASARSIVAVMLLSAAFGTTVRVETDGPDELAAMTAIVSLLTDSDSSSAVGASSRARGARMVSFALHGIGVSGGIAIGRAQLVSHATREVAHYTIPPAQVPVGDRALRRRDAAKCSASSKALHAALTSGDVPGEFGAFLDVHWMILNDPTLSEAPKRIIAEQRCNAEWALTLQMGVLVEQFEQIEDSYLRERKADVVQVGERVLKRLMGRPGTLPAPRAPRSRRSSSRTTCRRPT